MRILLTGASGYLGRYLAARLGKVHDVVGTYRYESAPAPGCVLRQLNLTEKDAVAPLVREAAPDIIIHAAAMSHPDPCEGDPEAAQQVNVEGTELLARAAAERGARMIFISTDLVFDGKKPPYRECDPPSPLCVYSRGKVEAERLVRELVPESLTLRLSWSYGWKPVGRLMFCDVLYRNLSAGKGMRLFSDQVRTMLYLEDTAEMIARVAEMKPWPEIEGRVLHLAGPERLSRLQFGEIFCEVFGLDRKLLDAIRSDRLKLAAMRPRDCSLDGSLLHGLIGFKPRTVAEGLRAMKKDRPSA
ncbi:MAG TPA: NAD(P)-dependent oxidoreductase [Elusimicrobia bacterium]|nr:NAD(P)-dependent oxidoreductase [Elusimicrobiota bacterium]